MIKEENLFSLATRAVVSQALAALFSVISLLEMLPTVFHCQQLARSD